MKVTEVRRKVSDNPDEKPISPYGTEEEMKAHAAEGFFVRDPERDLVYCPAGSTLRKKSIKKRGAIRYANKHVCSKCPYRDKCVTGKQDWKEIEFGKDKLEKHAKWWSVSQTEIDREDTTGTTEAEDLKKNSADTKKPSFHYEKKLVVQFKLRPDREKMDQRMCISEHPFETIKRALGASYILLKGLRKVRGEFALIATGYNISRAQNMYKFEELMALVGAEG